MINIEKVVVTNNDIIIFKKLKEKNYKAVDDSSIILKKRNYKVVIEDSDICQL